MQGGRGRPLSSSPPPPPPPDPPRTRRGRQAAQKYKARRDPAGAMAVERVAVLGSGVMGHGIAQVLATAGYRVSMRDIRQEFLDRGMGKIRWSLDKMVEREKITAGGRDDILSRITPVIDLCEAAGDADLVIEVVPEVMDLKKRVYAELDAAARPDTIFASNTSTLPITEIAAATSRPERFIGIHFFNPPQLMKLVEVIPGARTSTGTLEATRELVRSAGKHAVVCRKDVPGFIVNRLFIPMVHEACHLRDRTGASLEEIDSAVRFRAAFPMGIFELADFTGMDVVHKATEEMHMRDEEVVRPHPLVSEMAGSGRLGKKSGSGFYEYGEGHYERVGLSEELAARCDPMPLVAFAANNAAWLVSNGASDIGEIETAARLGLGLKAPLFETARSMGLGRIVSELRRLAADHGAAYEPDPHLVEMAGAEGK